MNIAILDDSKEELKQIRSVISSYYKSQNTDADIHLYSSAESFFQKYSPGIYDLIIMDIYMGNMTGMDAAKKLREAKDSAALIFITSSDSYAVESYDVNASYYLLKPFQPEKLCSILDSFQSRHLLASRYIEVVSDRIPIQVPLRSILYADTFRNAVCLHTDAGPIRSYLTFHKFEEQIRDCPNFLSCYRGCVVNMDRIQEASEEGFLLDNGEVVQIRKRGSSAIRKAYLQYLFASDEEISQL